MVCSDVYWRGVKRDAIWLGPIGPPNLENKYIWWIIVGSVWKCFKQGVGGKLSCRPNAKWVLSSPAPNSHSWLQLKVHRDTSRDKMCWLLGPFHVSSERKPPANPRLWEPQPHGQSESRKACTQDYSFTAQASHSFPSLLNLRNRISYREHSQRYQASILGEIMSHVRQICNV